MECKALEALLASGLLKEEEKNSLKDFDKNFKEDEIPFGFTYVENKKIIEKIKEALSIVGDFTMLRQHLAHLKQEENIVAASALLRADRIKAQQDRFGKAVEKDTAILTRELELAAEAIVDLRQKLASETEAKKEANERADDFASRLEKAELDLAALESLRTLAATIGQGDQRRQSRGDNRREEKNAQDEGDDWRVIDYGRGGSRANQKAPQNRDNRDNRDEQRKRGAEENSHFGLRDKDNKPYCQFQFTKPDGCTKGQECRYAKSHGMDDPHPDHESRNRKRPKKVAAPASKDKDKEPRGGKRDDRGRGNGENEWGNDLYNVD